MHRFSNALGEHCRLWYDLQLTTGCGSLWADAVRFLLILELSLPMLLPAPSLCPCDSSSLVGSSSLFRSGSQSSLLMFTTCKSLSNVRGGCRACEGCELLRERELGGLLTIATVTCIDTVTRTHQAASRTSNTDASSSVTCIEHGRIKRRHVHRTRTHQAASRASNTDASSVSSNLR